MSQSIVNLTRYYMITTGLWVVPITTNTFWQKCYRLYSLLVLFTINLFTVSLVSRLMQLIGEGIDPAKAFGNLTITLTICMLNYNVIAFLKNGIPYLFSGVLEEEFKSLNSRDEEIRTSYLSQVNYYKRTTICQIFSTYISGGMFIASNLYKKITDSLLEHEAFMYDMWLPFRAADYDNLIIAINIYLAVLASTYNIVSRIAPQTLIIFVNSQLQILQIRVRNIFADNEDDEEVLQFKLKILIQKHQALIRFVTFLNNSIRNVIFFEFVLNSVNVAAAVLQIITVKEIVERIFSIFHFCLIVMQITILAWSANEVNIQSTEIANSVYESSWLDQSDEIKKAMHIIMIRAQTPLALTIGPFKAMNIGSALVTMKAAYSYASLLIQKYT